MSLLAFLALPVNLWGQAPDIVLLGNATSIINGDNTPSIFDHTDFGNACTSGTGITRSFTIGNVGNDMLNLLNAPVFVTISGPAGADFVIKTAPAATIAGLTGTTSFEVTFTPTSAGAKTALLTIVSDDPDETPFTFSIQGSGVPAPVIITQPINQATTAPAAASFTVSANNTTGYQWQVNQGTGWFNIPLASPYSGTTAATMTLNPALNDLDGNAYQCILSNAACATLNSNAVGLVVNPGPCVNDAIGYGDWVFSGATIASNQACTGTGILFNAPGEFAVTPLIVNPLSLNFSKKRSTNTNAWELKIQVGSSATGPWTDVSSVTTIAAACSANASIDLTAFTGNRYIRFLDNRTGTGAEERSIDDVTITCGTSGSLTHSVTGFTPASGPPSTMINIAGTNLLGATGVKFGSISATNFSIVSATLITAEVPLNVATNKIIVTKGSCDAESPAFFTPVHVSGTCGTNGSS